MRNDPSIPDPKSSHPSMVQVGRRPSPAARIACFRPRDEFEASATWFTPRRDDPQQLGGGAPEEKLSPTESATARRLSSGAPRSARLRRPVDINDTFKAPQWRKQPANTKCFVNHQRGYVRQHRDAPRAGRRNFSHVLDQRLTVAWTPRMSPCRAGDRERQERLA